MKKHEREQKAQEQMQEFLLRWKESPEWGKVGLLHALKNNDHFGAITGETKFDFVISVLEKYLPKEFNSLSETYPQQEIFIKAFSLIPYNKTNHITGYEYVGHNEDSCLKKLERVSRIKKLLEILIKIEYNYFHGNNKIIETFFFKKGKIKNILEFILTSAAKFISSGYQYGKEEEGYKDLKEKIISIEELTCQMIVQSFNVDLFSGHSYNLLKDNGKELMPKVTQALKNEFLRCLTVISKETYWVRPESEEERIVKKGKFHERIELLLEVIPKTHYWIPLLSKILLLNGEIGDTTIVEFPAE